MEVPDFIKNRFWLKKGWINGIPADVEIPEKPIYEVIDEACIKFADRTAFVFYGVRIPYGMLKGLIDRFATFLASIGIKKGDVVAIYAPNCPQFAIAYYGAMKAGATITAISPLFAPREVEYQLNDSGAKVLVTVEQLYPNFNAIRKNTKVEKVIVANISGGEANVEGEFIDFRKALLSVEPNPPKISWNVKEDVAVLQYTGGTTGLPKAAMLTHYNVVANCFQLKPFTDLIIKWLQSHKVIREEGDYLILDFEGREYKTLREYYENGYGSRVAILPWYHIYGQTVDLNAGLVNGEVIHIFARFEPDKIFESIQEYRIMTFMGAPAIFIYYVNNPELFKKYDISSLIYVNNGAGPIPPEVVHKWDELTNKLVYLCEGYGLSEASPVTHTHGLPPQLRKRKVGSIGPPIPNTYAAIIDPNTLEFLPIGKEGELVVSGPQVMKGYWNRPKETEEVFFYADGMKWLRTGDIAKMDEDGYFYIVDRLKDIIKYKGHSVYPREIEDVIYEHPAVQEVCVIGIPDLSAGGETIKALVVLKPEYRGKLTEKELIDWCKERLATYKYPRIVEFRNELPKSAAGKYLRRVLRDEELKKMGIKK
ncbi:MAG: long-chain fatty acid--CoA ligase [Archaeoglobaceae archaeon]